MAHRRLHRVGGTPGKQEGGCQFGNDHCGHISIHGTTRGSWIGGGTSCRKEGHTSVHCSDELSLWGGGASASKLIVA